MTNGDRTRIAFITFIAVGAIGVATARLAFGIGHTLVSTHIAWLFAGIFAALAVLMCASIAFNLVTGRRWNEDNLFDKLADILTYLPWP